MNQTVILRYDGIHRELFLEWMRQFFNITDIKLDEPIDFSKVHKLAYENYKDDILKAMFIKFFCFLLFRGKISNEKLYRFGIDLYDQKERKDQNFQSINIVNPKLNSICPNIQYDISLISVYNLKKNCKYSYVMNLLKILTNEYSKKLGIVDCEIQNCVCSNIKNEKDLDRIEIIPCKFHTEKIGNIVGRTFNEQCTVLEELGFLLKDFFLLKDWINSSFKFILVIIF